MNVAENRSLGSEVRTKAECLILRGLVQWEILNSRGTLCQTPMTVRSLTWVCAGKRRLMPSVPLTPRYFRNSLKE